MSVISLILSMVIGSILVVTFITIFRSSSAYGIGGDFGPNEMTAAWAEVAAQSNRDLDAYLRTIDPTLPEHYGMPTDGVRRVVKKLTNNSTIKLTELIAAWDILHVNDTGDIGFCDLDKALEESGVTVINDVCETHPELEELTQLSEDCGGYEELNDCEKEESK